MICRGALKNESGASAAEFALVLPLLLLFLCGIIDAGRYMWSINRAEKAAQMGVRMAVVTRPIASGITTANYVGVGGLTQGDVIPSSAFGKITCTNSGCTCTTNPCPAIGTVTAANFNRIADRVRLFLPEAAVGNISVEYSSSGLGYAGDPNGADLAPLVTVRLSGLTFKPIVFLALGTIGLPQVTSSLTYEDGAGTVSN